MASTSLLGACFSPSVPIQAETATEDETSTGGSTGDGPTASSTAPTTTTSASTDATAATDSATSGHTDETTSGPAPAVCGNGEVEDGEACDDGVNDGAYGGCAADCGALGPRCGDGVSNGAEPCDDGNDANGDGCNLDCGISGRALWTRSFAGDAGFLDQATSVAVGAADGIVVAGAVATAPSDGDVLLLAYDADGSLLWDETYEFGANSRALSVALDADGNIGIMGDQGQVQVLTAMFDPSGGLLRSELLPDVGGGDIGGSGVAFDDSGDLYVVGQVYVGSYDISIRRYNEVGSLVWAESYDGGLDDTGLVIALDGDALFVSGGTFVSASDTNGWIRRYGLDGSPAWTREFAGADEAGDQAWGVAVDPNGSVVATGFSYNEDDVARAWLRKYDLDGAEQWTELYDVDPTGIGGFSLAVDTAGQIALLGVSNFESIEAFVAKHGPDGTQLWIDHPHEGSVQPRGVWPLEGVAIDSQSNIIVAGTLDSDVWVRSFGALSSLCVASALDDANACVADEVCAPLADEPFASATCIWTTGDVECPAGSDYSSRTLLHQDADDTRGCTACTCGEIGGTCSATLELRAQASCAGAIFTQIDAGAACGPVNGAFASAQLTDVEPNAMCGAATGDQPPGSAIPTDPITVCCLAG